MSDAMRVYTKVQAALKKILTNVSQARLEVMALMMSALVRKGECHLTQLASVAPSTAKTESISRRFQRFLSCDDVDVSAGSGPTLTVLDEELRSTLRREKAFS